MPAEFVNNLNLFRYLLGAKNVAPGFYLEKQRQLVGRMHRCGHLFETTHKWIILDYVSKGLFFKKSSPNGSTALAKRCTLHQ